MMKRWILAGMVMCTVLSVNAQTKKPAPAKPGAAKPATAKPAAAASIARGKVVFNQICASCHQADATGVPRMNPPLIKTKYVLGDKSALVGVLLKGLNEEVEINGEYYSNPMPSQATLTDEQIADVLTFVRNSFGNKASAVTPADVKKVRATVK